MELHRKGKSRPSF